MKSSAFAASIPAASSDHGAVRSAAARTLPPATP
jgi:hypothetical protein